MQFICKNVEDHPDKANVIVYWSEEEFAQQGNPVCPECDSDMVTMIFKK